MLPSDLRHWSLSVQRTTVAMNAMQEEFLKLRNTQPQAVPHALLQRLTQRLNEVKRNLENVSASARMIRRNMARYLVEEGDARKDLEGARVNLDNRLNEMNKKIQNEMARRGCAQGPGQLASFRQTVTSHVNSIASVSDDLHARVIAADKAGSVLLADSVQRTNDIEIVQEELQNAQSASEVDQALTHGEIAARAWEEYAHGAWGSRDVVAAPKPD